MFKYIILVAAFVMLTSAEPKPGVLAAAPLAVAPAVAPAYVTAQSSQVVARNFNALAAPIVAAAPLVAAPYRAPVVAGPAIASPYVAAPAHFAPYAAAPYYAASSPYLASSPVFL